MIRRHFLSSLFSAVGALFVGKAKAAPIVMVDTTTMHNEQWRTYAPGTPFLPHNMASITKAFETCSLQGIGGTVHPCDTLRIAHDGNGFDGYPTFLEVDGKILPDSVPSRKERAIVLICEIDQPLSVVVLTGDDELVVFQPTNFQFILHWIKVTTRVSPVGNWYVTLYGVSNYQELSTEQHVCNEITLPMTNFSMIFAEGMAVHTNIRCIASPCKCGSVDCDRLQHPSEGPHVIEYGRKA